MKPIRTTLVFGIISCLTIFFLSFVSLHVWAGSIILKLFFLLILLLYSMFLCRWSNTSLTAVLFPLLLVTGIALWPDSSTGFLLAVLVVLSWIRSGICFNHTPLRAFMAEILMISGGAGSMLLWRPDSSVTLALALWLFFLVQTLYFFIVSIVPPVKDTATPGVTADDFERAHREMHRLIGDNSTT